MSLSIAKPKVIPISSILVLESANPNKMTAEKFDKLKANIEKYGYLQPILVFDTGDNYTLVDGWHRLEAMKRLGTTEILAVVADGFQGEKQITPRMMRLAMNNLRGTTGYEALTEELKSLLEEGVTMEALPDTGVLEADIQALLAADSLDLEAALEVGEPPEDLSGGSDIQKVFYVSIKVKDAEEKVKIELALQTQAAIDNVRVDELLSSLLGVV